MAGFLDKVADKVVKCGDMVKNSWCGPYISLCLLLLSAGGIGVSVWLIGECVGMHDDCRFLNAFGAEVQVLEDQTFTDINGEVVDIPQWSVKAEYSDAHLSAQYSKYLSELDALQKTVEDAPEVSDTYKDAMEELKTKIGDIESDPRFNKDAPASTIKTVYEDGDDEILLNEKQTGRINDVQRFNRIREKVFPDGVKHEDKFFDKFVKHGKTGWSENAKDIIKNTLEEQIATKEFIGTTTGLASAVTSCLGWFYAKKQQTKEEEEEIDEKIRKVEEQTKNEHKKEDDLKRQRASKLSLVQQMTLLRGLRPNIGDDYSDYETHVAEYGHVGGALEKRSTVVRTHRADMDHDMKRGATQYEQVDAALNGNGPNPKERIRLLNRAISFTLCIGCIIGLIIALCAFSGSCGFNVIPDSNVWMLSIVGILGGGIVSNGYLFFQYTWIEKSKESLDLKRDALERNQEDLQRLISRNKEKEQKLQFEIQAEQAVYRTMKEIQRAPQEHLHDKIKHVYTQTKQKLKDMGIEGSTTESNTYYTDYSKRKGPLPGADYDATYSDGHYDNMTQQFRDLSRTVIHASRERSHASRPGPERGHEEDDWKNGSLNTSRELTSTGEPSVPSVASVL